MSTNDSLELSKCPFCGGEACICNRFGDIPHLWYAECVDCAACGSLEKDEAEAAAAWNTRHVETCSNKRGICSACGSIMYDAPNFCPSCGRKVEG